MRKYLFVIIFLLCAGCEEQLPTAQYFPILQTQAIADVDETGATFRAKLLQSGATGISSYGFVWDTQEPLLDAATSTKVELGTNLHPGDFEKRIDSAHSKGITYYVRAFATYTNKTVYGNTLKFTSQGSNKSSWSLLNNVKLEGSFQPYGSANGERGHVLFTSAQAYEFNPEDNTFTKGIAFPFQGNSGTKFTSVLVGDTQYFFSNINRNLYRKEKYGWHTQSVTPFNYYVFGGYYQGHASANRIFLLSSYVSYMYDLQTDSWQQKAKVPVSNGSSIAGASLGGKAYVMTSDKRIWEYNEASDSWLHKTTYPGRLYNHILSFSLQNRLYFGMSNQHYYASSNWMDNALWSYDPVTDKWETQEPFPVPLSNIQLFYFTLQNKLYLGSGHINYNLWVYDPKIQ